MTFDELVQETLVIVKRPDLLGQIERAVRAAVLKIHSKDFFYRDLVETGIQFTSPAPKIHFEPKLIYPRFRKPKYVRNWHYDETDLISYGHAGIFLDAVAPGNLIDYFGFDKTNVFYMAGNLLQLRSHSDISHILFGFFQYPDTTDAGFSSWIADEQPEAIYREAARAVFKGIGFDEQSAEQNALAAEQYQILTINNIPDNGE